MQKDGILLVPACLSVSLGHNYKVWGITALGGQSQVPAARGHQGHLPPLHLLSFVSRHPSLLSP